MTLFFICAALLVLLSVGWLLFGLFRASAASTDQEAVNITLARERRKTLEAALSEGAIDQPTYDYEREQLEHDLAAELTHENKKTMRSGGHVGAAIVVCAFVPIAAGALYLHLGNPAAITQSREAPVTIAADAPDNAAAMAQMLPQMEERLAQTPDDIEGWRLLGRSYLSIGEYNGARRAFESALALNDTDVPTMTQLAESIAMTQQGDLSGKPLQYVTRANQLDPENEHALWLLSIAQQQAGDHQTALQGFDRLIELAEGNTDALATIGQMRVRSVEALSEGSSTDSAGSGDSDASVEPTEASASQSAADEPSISVIVKLSEQAGAAATDDQVVFVYAVATEGPPMPLAVSRLTVADLPATVSLDNSMAMIPNMTLSAFQSVTVGARISASGNAIAQSGDWFSEAFDIDPTNVEELTLNIDQQKP